MEGEKDKKDTQTDAGTCTSVLAACFLSFFISFSRSFFRAAIFFMSAFPLTTFPLLFVAVVAIFFA